MAGIDIVISPHLRRRRRWHSSYGIHCSSGPANLPYPARHLRCRTGV